MTRRLAGPLRTLWESLDESTRTAVEQLIREAAGPYEGSDGRLSVPERMLAASAVAPAGIARSDAGTGGGVAAGGAFFEWTPPDGERAPAAGLPRRARRRRGPDRAAAARLSDEQHRLV